MRLIISVLTTSPSPGVCLMLMSCDIPDIPRTIQQYPVTTLRVMADADSVREKIGNYTAISLLL